MPRKTDSNNPADWLHIATADLEGISRLVADELAYSMCRSKLAEVLEKILKAELIRLGWPLVKTHDLLVLGTTMEEKHSDLVAQIRPLCILIRRRLMGKPKPVPPALRVVDVST